MNHLSPRSAQIAVAPPGEHRIATLRARMAEYPERVGIRLRLASLLKQQGFIAEAEDVLRQTVAHAPGNRRAVAELETLLAEEQRPSASPGPESQAGEPVADHVDLDTQATHPRQQTAPAPLPDLPELFARLRASQVEMAGPVRTGRPGDPARQAAGWVAVPPRRLWRPQVELVVAVSLVLCVGLLGVASRRPSDRIGLPSAEISLLQGESGAPATLRREPPVTSLPPARLAAAPTGTETAVLDPILPRVAVASVPRLLPDLSDLPSAAPLDVTVFYPDHGTAAMILAEDVAARLRRGATVARIASVPATRSGQAEIVYYFDEDQAAARSVADQLGIGAVRRLAAAGGTQPPGAIAVILRPAVTHAIATRKDAR